MKAVFPLILAIVASGCSDERKDSAWWANERQIIELNNHLELARFELEHTDRGKQDPPREHGPESIERLKREIADLTLSKRQLETEIASMGTNWESFRRGVLAERRSALAAQSYEELTTSQGKTFSNVTITSIDDGGVSLRHASGTARLRCEDLDPDELAHFGLDREFASAVYAMERQRLAKYEAGMKTQLAALEKKQEKNRELQRQREERLEASRTLAAANARANPVPSRPLSSSIGRLGETSFFSSRPSYRYSASYPYRQRGGLYRYYYTSPSSCRSAPTYFNSGCQTYRPGSGFPSR